MFKKTSLKLKLVTLLLLIGVVPAVLISFLAYNSTAKQLREDAYRQMQMFADLADQQMQDYIEGKEAELEVLAVAGDVYQSLNVLREVDGDTADPRWQERVKLLECLIPAMMQGLNLETVLITSADGKAAFSSDKTVMAGDDFSDRDYVQGALAGHTLWSEIFYSPITQGNVQSVSAPVKSSGDSGAIVGTLSLIINQAIIDETVHHGLEGLARTADSFLIDGEGLLLSNTARGEYAQDAALKHKINSPAVSFLSSPIKSGNSNFYQQEEYKNHLGKDVLGALIVTELAGNPMGFVVEIEAAEVLAGVAAMRNLMITIAVICAVIIAVAAFFIAQTIVRPVKKVSDLTQKLAEGDFTVQAAVRTRDEIGQMSEHLNRTVQSLNETLKSVHQSSDNVSHASSEISSGNQDLSQRTQEQASSLEEIASTIEEISSSVEASSANTAAADKIAKEAVEDVIQGEKAVAEMQQAMVEITRGSQEIAEIIATVNDIAFQTNLLALNAAVEAARAGEQGRGFAVVAAEVRNLAGRAAESAKEIEKRIKDSIARVDKGNALMDETNNILQKVVTETEKAGDVVGEIAAAQQQLAAAVKDIRDAIEELNQVTQQNASLVEEIASSSENMNSEAIELAERISFFKLADNGYQQHQTGKPGKAIPRQKNNQKETVDIIDRENSLNFDDEDFEKY